MIVRNGADHLPGCLRSVQDIVDEIVIGDTGSTDQGPVLALSMGARVVPIPWTNHFAEARNRILDTVSSDWVLVLDADERLDPTTSARLRAHLNPAWDGYQVTIRNYTDRPDARLWDRLAEPNDGLLPESTCFPAWLGHQNVRLFRKDPVIRFSGRVHESVGPSLEAHGLRLGAADFLIHHLGFVMPPEVERRKSALYRELGKQKLQDSPGNAQSHFEVGLEELTRGAGAGAALSYFIQACRLNPSFAVSWLFGAIALSMLGHIRQAEEFLSQAESLGYRSPLMVDLRGDLLYRHGDFAGAGECYRQLWAGSSPGPEAESKLGLALWRGGSAVQGLQHLRHAIQTFPGAAANYDRLIGVLVAQDQIEAAAEVADRRLQAALPQPSAYLKLASLHAQMGNLAKVRETLQAGCQAFPDDAGLLCAARDNGVFPEIGIHGDGRQKS